MRSNCLVFALALYWRRKSRGVEGYVLMRRSRWGAFPHLLYAERRSTGTWRVVSYTPDNPRHKQLPPPLFSGHVHWGDR